MLRLWYNNAMNKIAESITNNKDVSHENFVTEGKVFILGPFDRGISGEVIPGVLALVDQMSSQKDPSIDVYINSHGGYSDELWGLLTVLQIAKNRGIKINTHVIGVAYSCGSMLAVFGDHRTMSRYGDNVAHLGGGGYEVRTLKQVDRESEFFNKHFNKIIDFYAAHTKVPRKKIAEMLSDDHLHLDPEMCLKLGFCDEIV